MPEFVSTEMLNQINVGKHIKSDKRHDLYQLSLCLYLILGDQRKKLFEFIVNERELKIGEKEAMVINGKYKCNEIVKKLLIGELSAENAAIKMF